MKTVQEIRYANLKKLVDEYGGGDLTAALKRSKSWNLEESTQKLNRPTLYQILTGIKTANDTVRSVGNELARKIESEFRLTHGWMDIDHDADAHAPSGDVRAINPEQLIELIALFGESTEKGRELIIRSARQAPKAGIVTRRDTATDQG